MFWGLEIGGERHENLKGSGKGTIGGRERKDVLSRLSIFHQESTGRLRRDFDGVGWVQRSILNGYRGNRSMGVVEQQ